MNTRFNGALHIHVLVNEWVMVWCCFCFQITKVWSVLLRAGIGISFCIFQQHTSFVHVYQSLKQHYNFSLTVFCCFFINSFDVLDGFSLLQCLKACNESFFMSIPLLILFATRIFDVFNSTCDMVTFPAVKYIADLNMNWDEENHKAGRRVFLT